MKKPSLFPLARKVLHSLDAETAHDWTIKALAAGLYLRDNTPDIPALAQTVFGIRFTNPVGMAAGFDKNAAALKALTEMGFGFVEAGTVTPRPQAGNPRPRVFRDPTTKSVINRMGFAGLGADVFFDNFTKFRETTFTGIVGINIGKNKDTEDPAADYLTLVARMAPIADYLTINISSPNTPGLRDLQKRDFLMPFLESVLDCRAKACGATRQPPVLVKLAPDLAEHQMDEISSTLLESGIDGLILSNTTLDRPETLPADFCREAGGLSGPLLRNKSTVVIRGFYARTQGKLPIIGVGGISSAADAYAKIRAGASLVQLYTALVYEGPALVKDIKSGLAELLQKDGFTSITEAIGIDHK